jgi:hypothetical protein
VDRSGVGFATRVKAPAPNPDGTQHNTSNDNPAATLLACWASVTPDPSLTSVSLGALEVITGWDYRAVHSWLEDHACFRAPNNHASIQDMDFLLQKWSEQYPGVLPHPKVWKAFARLPGLDGDKVYRWFYTNVPTQAVLTTPDSDPIPLRGMDEESQPVPNLFDAASVSNEDPGTSAVARSEFEASVLACATALRNCTNGKTRADINCNMQKAPDPRKRFPCVLGCGQQSATRSEFVRHEAFYPQKAWVCSLWNAGHAGQVSCSEKPLTGGGRSRGGRVFFRADHLRQHHKNHHGHLPNLGREQVDSCMVAFENPTYPSRCGFCGYAWISYQARVDHILKHFKDGKSLAEWEDPWVDRPRPEDYDSDNSDDPDDDQDNDDGHGDSEGPSSFHDTFDDLGYGDSDYQDPNQDGGWGGFAAQSFGDPGYNPGYSVQSRNEETPTRM